MSNQNQTYQKEAIEEERRNIINTIEPIIPKTCYNSPQVIPHWPFHQPIRPNTCNNCRNSEWTLEKAAKAIEDNIKDNLEIINREKDKIYKMASHYEYVRDHSVEIANIKADVAQREEANKIYEHCLRIVKGEQKY